MKRKKMKRANGTGSVSYLGKGRRNPYCARLPTGDGKYEILGYFPTRKDAESALGTLCAQRTLGMAPPPGSLNVTVGECWEAWSSRELAGASTSKRKNYEIPWNRILYKYKDRPIRLMSVDSWQDIVDADSASGLSSGSVGKLISLIHTLCKFAMERDYIIKDYSQFIKAPAHVAVVEKGALTHSQIEALIQRGNDGDFIADAAVLMCYTGFRIEEILPLTPDDFDGTAWTLKGGEKTRAGKERIVPVCSHARYILTRLLARGGKTIICKRNGTRYSAHRFRTLFDALMVEIGAPAASPHWARYTFNSLCHEGGIDLLTQKWLTGHSTDADITHHYTISTIEQLQAAVEKLWWPDCGGA